MVYGCMVYVVQKISRHGDKYKWNYVRLLFMHFVLPYTYTIHIHCTLHTYAKFNVEHKNNREIGRKEKYDRWVVKRLICKSSWMLWRSYWNSIPDIIWCLVSAIFFKHHVYVWAVKLIPLELRKQNKYQKVLQKNVLTHKFLLWIEKKKNDGKSDPSDYRCVCVYNVHNARKKMRT